ncbi:hypothetical protein ABEF95_009281 [Exophiala dermatitidis]
MRRCFEHAQLKRYWQRYRLSLRFSSPPGRFHRTLSPSSPPDRHDFAYFGRRCLSSRPSAVQNVSTTRYLDNSSPKPADEIEHQARPQDDLDSNRAQSEHAEHCVALLEQFLPAELRRIDPSECANTLNGNSDFKKLLDVLIEARTTHGVDSLSHLVLNERRYKAVLHLVDVLLKPFGGASPVPAEEQLPSNIIWPAASLSKISRQPIELDHDSHVGKGAFRALSRTYRSSFDEIERERILQHLWPFLAELVLASTRRPPDEAKAIMNTVYQILARVHNLDLIPPSVYTHALPAGTTTVQRPPILNLLSARILSTLSDAVWRSQQDEAIARALKEGRSFRDVSHHPPGGRFRLKVRELGPEVWLEFLLWCCVEGGFVSAGTRIVNALQQETEGKWSPVHWTGSQGIDQESPKVDWDRAKRQHGGPVGQREAYSGDKPLVEVPPRTVSAEVVLALVESLINSLDAGSAQPGVSVDTVMSEIGQLLSFLGRHELTPAYLDYLTVRFLQTEAVRNRGQLDTLRDWASMVSLVKTPGLGKVRPSSAAAFDFDAVIEHSELQAAVLHQGLQVYIDSNLVSKAVDTFTDIQKLVDHSKLKTIGEFLAMGPLRSGFFSSRLRGQIDYTNTHGQLPMYKLAPFLKLVADAKLFGLGDWMLFSEDVDGPLIPPSAYRQPSIAIALCRYAAARDDRSLVQSILLARKGSSRRPPVNLLRALVNTLIVWRDWDTALFLLRELKGAEGGGYSPSMVAHLAATILRLEAEPADHTPDGHLSQATTLLKDILVGRYDSSGAFRIDQKAAFRRQTGLLLRFIESMSGSSIQAVPAAVRRRFPLSNEPLLAADTFNILLSAVVDTRGALAGKLLWETFCAIPTVGTVSDGQMAVGSVAGGLPEASGSLPKGQRPSVVAATHDGYIPFEQPDTVVERPSPSPIVVPNVRTIQIIVRAALAERFASPKPSRETRQELDQLLQWARPLFKAFKLSDEDVEIELSMSGSLPEGYSRGASNLKWQGPKQTLQEKDTFTVGSQFNNAAFVPRPPRRHRRKEFTVKR